MTAAVCDEKLLIRRVCPARSRVPIQTSNREQRDRPCQGKGVKEQKKGHRHRSVLARWLKRPIIVGSYTLLGGRSTVGQQTLTLLIGVRIPASQPAFAQVHAKAVSPKRRSREGGLPHFLAQMHASFACFELRLGRTFGPATTNSNAILIAVFRHLQYFSTP